MQYLATFLGGLSLLIGIIGLGFVVSPFGEMTIFVYIVPMLGLLFGLSNYGILYKAQQSQKKYTPKIKPFDLGFWAILFNALAFAFIALQFYSERFIS